MTGNLKHTILIIDDDLTIRKLLSHHLKNNNFTTIEAKGAEEGFQILEEKKIDLVLCDVTMDEMDGFTFCTKVRENQNFRTIPFVFVTAKSSIEDKSTAMDVGGDDIISKPFDVNELLLKVRVLLKRTEIYKTYSIKKNLEEAFTREPSKILLVDDDPSFSRLLQFNLQNSGLKCEVSDNAEDALRLASQLKPDLIISDIIMPSIDGYQFRKKILEDENLRSIPFLFVTSKDDEKDILEGYKMGITHYITKTDTPKVIIAKINATLQSLQSERQRIIGELHSAADSLRAKVVPESAPEFKGYMIKQWHKTFQGIPGGDFIDYFQIDENNLAVVLGDVMGKKWNAWYFAFAYAGYVRSALRVVLQTANEYSPGEIIQQVNKTIYQDAKVSEVFATLSVVIISKISDKLKYSGAGDLPIIFKKKSGDFKKIQSGGLLLGFAEDGGYKDEEIFMEPGDSVILMTDGIIESRNNEGIQFGTSKLPEIFLKTSSENNFLEKIKEELEIYTSGKYEDDISLISIQAG